MSKFLFLMSIVYFGLSIYFSQDLKVNDSYWAGLFTGYFVLTFREALDSYIKERQKKK